MSDSEQVYDVVIVGAGISGLYMLHKARENGFSAIVLEKAPAVGGTWFWNRYPGARCDVPSLEYSYSFDEALQQEWEWTEHHATQPEIERYINHVADRFHLRDGIALNTKVERAEWTDEGKHWVLTTDRGVQIHGRYLVGATGALHTWIEPNIPGVDTFEGELYFSNHWPQGLVDFTGKRIGIVGTGSTGVQSLAALSQLPIDSVTIFQRSPGFIVPSHDHVLEPEFVAEYKATYRERRERARRTGYGIDVTSAPIGEGKTADLSEEEFQRRAEIMWSYGSGATQTIFPDYVVDPVANDRIADFIRSKVREVVTDQELAEKLMSRGYYLGEKRLVIADGYFEAFNQENVHLVDVLEDPIVEINATGVKTVSGQYDFDLIIMATGFDSSTGSMLALNPKGVAGRQLSDVWINGHRTFLGIGVPDMPNLFMVGQAGSPGIRSHVMVTAEVAIEWITDFLNYQRKNEIAVAEVHEPAAESWTKHLLEVADTTLLTIHDSMHLGSNVPGKPRMITSYLGGVARWSDLCNEAAGDGYRGYRLSKADGSVFSDQPDWEEPEDVRWENRDNKVGRTANVI